MLRCSQSCRPPPTRWCCLSKSESLLPPKKREKKGLIKTQFRKIRRAHYFVLRGRRQKGRAKTQGSDAWHLPICLHAYLIRSHLRARHPGIHWRTCIYTLYSIRISKYYEFFIILYIFMICSFFVLSVTKYHHR